MQRFILEQNIERFRARLADAPDPGTRERIRTMLSTSERELALLNSGIAGARARAVTDTAPDAVREAMIATFREEFARSPRLAALYDPAPGLPIAAVNETFLAAIGRPREAVEGQPLFLVFPDNPDEPNADGVANLYASLRQVAATGRPHAMADQRYDVRGDDGRFVERWWRPVNTPLLDGERRVVFILHVVEEVTAGTRGRRKADKASA